MQIARTSTKEREPQTRGRVQTPIVPPTPRSDRLIISTSTALLLTHYLPAAFFD